MSDRRFAICMHILVLLAKHRDEWLPSDLVAGSININPVLVRKELSAIRKAGLIISKEGKNGGCMLAKSPDEIYLSDIFKIVNSGAILGNTVTAPNQNCPVGKQINAHLQVLTTEVENVLIGRLQTKSLAEFSQNFL